MQANQKRSQQELRTLCLTCHEAVAGCQAAPSLRQHLQGSTTKSQGLRSMLHNVPDCGGAFPSLSNCSTTSAMLGRSSGIPFQQRSIRAATPGATCGLMGGR